MSAIRHVLSVLVAILKRFIVQSQQWTVSISQTKSPDETTLPKETSECSYSIDDIELFNAFLHLCPGREVNIN